MIARVVPALKLPAPFQYFDYQIPPGLNVAPGDFVRVPFRGQSTLGIVLELSRDPESPRYRLKTVVDAIPGLRFSPALLEVLRETSIRIKSNLPFLLHALVPEMPLRSPASPPPPPGGRVGERVPKSELQIFSSPSDRLAIYKKILRTSRGQTLIIAPEVADVRWLAEGLRAAKKRIVTLTSELSKKAAWTSYAAFATGAASTLIGTRIAALIPAPRLARVIIDRDEDSSHFQADMHPRYDARDILDLRAEREQVPLTIVSETPRAERVKFFPLEKWGEQGSSSPIVLSLRDHWRGGNAGFVTSTLYDAISRARDAKLQTVLFLNRKGFANLMECRECRELITARGVLFCPRCQSPDLKERKPGIARIAADIKKQFPDATIEVLERVRGGQRPLPYPSSAEIIVTTEVFLHWYRTRAYTERIGCVGILFPDPLWHKPDFRANESAVALLRSFQNLATERKAEFIVQTADPDARAIRALAGELQTFYTEELADRQALGYPPYDTPHRKTS